MCVAVPMFHSIFSMSEDILPLIMSLGMIDDHQNTFRTRIWFYCSLVCLFAYVFLYMLFHQHYHDDICACNIIIYKCSMQISLSKSSTFLQFYNNKPCISSVTVISDFTRSPSHFLWRFLSFCSGDAKLFHIFNFVVLIHCAPHILKYTRLLF